MIILQTGVPGSGKTASIVNMLMFDESYTHFTDKDGQKKKRPLFVNGIPELTIEHEQLSDEQIKEKGLQDFLPYGSLVIIDEAQRLMGTRSSASKVPEFIEKLALHRHHGLDIVLITQHPSFLDAFVRKLVQRHMHISIKPVGRKLYEWNECVDQPDSTVNIARAIERSFVLPKKAFGQYKSAEVHTKPKRRIPKSLVFLIIFLPVLIGFTAYTVIKMGKRFSGDGEVQQTSVSADASGSPSASPMPAAPSSAVGHGQSLTPDLYVPTLAEKPESKPLYDGVRQVKTFERVAACISGGSSGCTCYSDQATPLKEVTAEMCKDYVKNGLPFNPYKHETAQNRPSEASAGGSPAPAGEVLVMGGKSPQNLMYDGYVEAGAQFRP